MKSQPTNDTLQTHTWHSQIENGKLGSGEKNIL